MSKAAVFISVGFCFLVFIIIILVTLEVFQTGIEQGDKTLSFCDNKYGKDNWEFVDITGTPEAREIVGSFYIGQVWQCQELEK